MYTVNHSWGIQCFGAGVAVGPPWLKLRSSPSVDIAGASRIITTFLPSSDRSAINEYLFLL